MEDYDDQIVRGPTEAELIESWKLEQFTRWEIPEEVASKLLAWDADLHYVEHLLYRDGERTTCDWEQLLAILEPLPV